MKKMVLGVALAAAASAFAVESNVVGYQTISINPGFNMIAFNFQPLDGTENVSIQDFISNKGDLVAGSAAGNSDQIQVWDGSKFSIYFYKAKKTTMPGKFMEGPAWVSLASASTPTTDTVPRGSGVWFARPSTESAGAITVSGAINAASKTHDIAAGFNMISSAFPVAMPLNNGPIDWAACGAVAGSAAGNSDQIQVWDGSQFTIYFYKAKKTTMPGKFMEGPAWVSLSAASTPTTDSIPAGKGFWYARPSSESAGTLVETSPLAAPVAE